MVDRAQTFLDSFFAHEETRYYDAAKAHEYYLKRRELKGRKGLKGEAKKQAWDYSKKAIGEAKKADMEGASANRIASVEKARETAAKRRAEISEKLSALLKHGTKKQKALAREEAAAEREKLRGELKATLDTARSNYETLKKELVAKYEAESDNEYEAIRQNV